MLGAKGPRILGALTICFAVLLSPAAMSQDAVDKAIATRQGFMKLVVWEAGPLFGMAKGEMAYDAEAAKAHAANLKTLSGYPVEALFLSGTSKTDRPGKTRALPKIWEDMNGFNKALTDWRAAVGALDGEVGEGQAALAAAVSELGKACGACHKPYRAKEF